MKKKKMSHAARREASRPSYHKKPREQSGNGASPQTREKQADQVICLMPAAAKKAARKKELCLQDPFDLRIQARSPLALGSGLADVNVDTDIVHDACGLPEFPAKRLKGLLYESAVEITEMAELSGLPLFTRQELDTLFQHGEDGPVQIVLSDLTLENSQEIKRDWRYLLNRYPELFRPDDVLDTYALLRYQTKIDKDTGTAADTSLRNIRVLDAWPDAPVCFTGRIRLEKRSDAPLNLTRSWAILALAARNLSAAGLKRTRGFGQISVSLEQKNRDAIPPLMAEILPPVQDTKKEKRRT
jgi:hypothetical protein